MFEQTFVDGVAKTRKPWTVVLSFVGQCVAIGILILIPLIYTDTLPQAQLMTMITAPPPPPPPPPPPQAAPPVQKVKFIPRQFDAGKLMAPKEVPKTIAVIKDDSLPPPSTGLVSGVAGGTGAGALGGILGGASVVAPPPPPPPPPEVKKPSRIRVGGNVQQANLIKKVQPVYPALAKQARIQGTVRFTAIIGKDGSIQNLQLVSGHPLLVAAAEQAVKQWVYKPTLLNGDPVEVVTNIDVNFTLSQ